jgi:hypothetical protein
MTRKQLEDLIIRLDMEQQHASHRLCRDGSRSEQVIRQTGWRLAINWVLEQLRNAKD